MFEEMKALIRKLEQSSELPDKNPMPYWDYDRAYANKTAGKDHDLPRQYDNIRNACLGILSRVGSEDNCQ